jgi:hypothetical protein
MNKKRKEMPIPVGASVKINPGLPINHLIVHMTGKKRRVVESARIRRCNVNNTPLSSKEFLEFWKMPQRQKNMRTADKNTASINHTPN